MLAPETRTFVPFIGLLDETDRLIALAERMGRRLMVCHTQRYVAPLIEARRMVEIGAAQLAAVNRSKEDLDSLAASIEEMRSTAEFVQITAAGMRESHVHDVQITKEAPNYRLE